MYKKNSMSCLWSCSSMKEEPQNLPKLRDNNLLSFKEEPLLPMNVTFDDMFYSQSPEQLDYTAEPIYSYMIGKDARHSHVSISRNDHL